MRDVAILSAVRTPIGRAVKGNLRHTRPDDFAALVVKESLTRAGVKAEDMEDLVLGCATPEGEQGLNFARLVGHLAGLPDEVPAMTINRFCSSGLQAVGILADRIAVGSVDAGIAGGAESMSMLPMGGARVSLNPKMADVSIDAYLPMGNTAENVARQFNVSRADQDKFAYDSHQKAVRAWAEGKFTEEVLPVK
ncbi:MAG TPA: acetyl-CoA C-acyltransferase, partial [Polyangia bacterium]